MKGKKVLVTGGSGFIGSHLVKKLHAEGAEVGILLRYNSIMKSERLRPIWEDVRVIEADLRNRGALSAVRKFAPEVVFHLAAYNHVGESFIQVEECFDVNAKGTANLLDVCGDAKKFVYMSTSEVYGYQTSVPFRESMTPNPISPYSITKYAGELYCAMKQKMRETSVSIVNVRVFNAYGPYQSAKAVIPELILNCLAGHPVRTTKGEQTREFNFVTDLVEGLVRLGAYPEKIEGIINLCSGQEIAIKDLILKIAELTQTRSKIEIGALPYRPTEIWRMSGDNERVKKLLGWAPKISMEDGLRQTVEWFRQYREELEPKNKELA